MSSGTGASRSEIDITRLCRSVAGASPIPTAAVQGESHIVRYANPALCLLVKRREEELVGKPFSAFAADAQECLLRLDRVFRNGQPEFHLGSESTALHPFRWSYAIWPIVGDEDGVLGTLIQVTETEAFHSQVTEMNQALLIGSLRQHELAEAAESLNVLLQTENKARKEAETELLRANRDLEQFALAASHDLQEPLRMVISFSELLRKGYESHLTGSGLEYLDFITKGARQMRQLLKDLLAYARAGKDAEEPVELIDLNVVMEQVLDNLEWSIEEAGGSITCDVLPSVYGHSAHFVQVFQNLIGNATKYRAERPLSIRVLVEKLDNEWRFAVADNGMGIDPKYHQQVFGVFKRLHRDNKGTGIGLAICQRVVEQYGGRIWVESQSGEGATFFFTLPTEPGKAGPVVNGPSDN